MALGDQTRADEDEICALYLRSRLLGLRPNKAALRSIIKTMSRRVDTEALSAADVACCLSIDTVPLATRVNLEDGLYVATAERMGA